MMDTGQRLDLAGGFVPDRQQDLLLPAVAGHATHRAEQLGAAGDGVCVHGVVLSQRAHRAPPGTAACSVGSSAVRQASHMAGARYQAVRAAPCWR